MKKKKMKNNMDAIQFLKLFEEFLSTVPSEDNELDNNNNENFE